MSDLEDRLAQFRRQVADAEKARKQRRKTGTTLAKQALKHGYSERATAELLGINRTTLRQWLNKP